MVIALKEKLKSGDGHFFDSHSWRIHTAQKFEVVGGGQGEIHILQVAGYGHFINWKSYRSVFDPKSSRRLTVISCYAIDSHAHQLGHIKALFDVTDQFG